MIALIDGDILRYRIGFACETHYYDIYAKGDEDRGCLASFETAAERDFWIDQYIGSKEDATVLERWIPDKIENCLHSVKMQLEFILNSTEAEEYRIFLSGKDNYRDTLVDYYKANRKDSRKPFYYEAIGEYLIEYWNAEVIDGQEADDALGIEQYKEYKKRYSTGLNDHANINAVIEETIICTIDKDLDNIPGWHYNFVKDEKYWVDEEQAMLNFYLQLLTGDSADNIPGLYKITGQKAFKRVLEPLAYCTTEKDMWDYVLHTYTKAFFITSPEDCNIDEIKDMATIKLKEIGQLLWIRREGGEMWRPPK